MQKKPKGPKVDEPTLGYLGVKEVAAIADCSVRHIMDEIKKKKLRAFKPGRSLRFRENDVQDWISRKAVS